MTLCKRCVLPESYPGTNLDEQEVCNYCLETLNNEQTLKAEHFIKEEEVIECLKKYKKLKRKYDVLVPISGGVDSCFTLLTIVTKYKLNALAFHNDHGYEDKTATENVRKICKALDVDLIIKQQDLRFMKKLWKFVNEADIRGINSCYVCGNILYLNALELAEKYNIPLVINGYSKGQVLKINDQDEGLSTLERLVGVFRRTGDQDFLEKFLEKYRLLELRKNYQSKRDLEEEADPSKILVMPFFVFNFYRTDKKELKDKISSYIDWKPMKTSYPNRTTNCEMVWLNTYMDLKKMGYSGYDPEYAELIRKGEISREQALKDLEFKPPKGMLERLASETGIDLERFDKEKDTAKKNKKIEDKGKNIKEITSLKILEEDAEFGF